MTQEDINRIDKEAFEELKKFAPISLLTPEQLFVAIWKNKNNSQIESIKYINSIIQDGLKIAKTYYDLYVREKKYMTQEEKNLLLKDLCARLPYGVIVEIQGHYDDGERFIRESEFDNTMLGYLYDDETIIKPYLRPMSSMTEEELKEFQAFHCVNELHPYFYQQMCNINNESNMFDWLNAHHFDYRWLIEKGLAIEVTPENNPYK